MLLETVRNKRIRKNPEPLESDRQVSRRLLWDRSVTFIFLVGICISILSFRVVRSQEVRSALDEFHLAAISSEYDVRRAIETDLATLNALRAYIDVTPNPSGPDFERFTQDLARNNPWTLSLKWVPPATRLPLAEASYRRFEMPLYLPVFEGAPEHQRLRGYALGLFQMGAVIEKSLPGVKSAPIDVEFYDLNAALGKRFLYRLQKTGAIPLSRYKSEAQALAEGAFKHIVRFDVGGRQWAMVITAADSSRPPRLTWLSWSIVATVLIITAISAAHFLLHVTRARTDEERLHLQLRKAAEDALRISEERYALAGPRLQRRPLGLGSARRADLLLGAVESHAGLRRQGHR